MAEIPTWVCVVAGALRAADGKWLMHRRPPEKHHGGLWEFPGGKVEPAETPRNALVRELREELGIGVDAAHPRPVAFAESPAGADGAAIVILLYTLTEWTGTPAALERGAELAWFTSEEIAALPRPPLDVVLCQGLFAARPTGRVG